MKKSIFNKLIILFLYSFSFAQQPQDVNQQLQIDKFKINIDPVATKRIENRYRRYKAIMNDTYNMKILLKPLVLPLSSVVTVYGHPNFISTLIFPDSFKIISATTTVPMKEFSYSKNTILLSPKRDVDIGNIVITAYDRQTKENKIFNFLFKPYSLTSLKYDTEFGMYATDMGAFFSFTIKFVQMPSINPIEVLKKYVAIFGKKKFNYVFRKNHFYDAVLINHIPIYIMRDEESGNIYYMGKKFRISIGVKQ